MIRRDARDEIWLIAQTEKAGLAARLVARVGNDRFIGSSRCDALVLATRLTAAGWSDRVLLDESGFPLDDDAVPLAVSFAAWSAAAEAAAGQNAYAGLLVACEALGLSALQAGRVPPRGAARAQRFSFDVNRFQNRMIELQETLRRSLGLRIDRPLRLGLADGWTNVDEDALRFDLRWLEAAGTIATAVIRSIPRDTQTGPVFRRPKDPAVRLRLDCGRPDRLLVSPWPFDSAVIEEQFEYRSLAALPHSSVDAVARVLTGTHVRQFTFAICPG